MYTWLPVAWIHTFLKDQIKNFWHFLKISTATSPYTPLEFFFKFPKMHFLRILEYCSYSRFKLMTYWSKKSQHNSNQLLSLNFTSNRLKSGLHLLPISGWFNPTQFALASWCNFTADNNSWNEGFWSALCLAAYTIYMIKPFHMSGWRYCYSC